MIEWSLNSLNVPEIEEFIGKHDEERHFSTRENFYKNFLQHFLKLLAVKQVVSFREDGKLVGFVSWALVDKHRKSEINKIRWTLPENVTEGDILYIDLLIVEDRKVNFFDIRKYLLRERYKDKQFKEIFWHNVGAGKVFRRKIKKEALCQTVG